MSLIWALVAPAFAARVYWVSPPTDADRAAVARALPEARSAPVAELGGRAPLGPEQTAALDALRQELAAVRPLIETFDGELAIMARLSKATADVGLLASPADRALLFEALAFQGYAVHRYWQDRLGTDPGATPYRSGEGAGARVAAWVDAAALRDGPALDPALVPDAAERLAYDAVQAETRGMPAATLVVGPLAAGAEVFVDGAPVEGGPGARLLLTPGRHFVHVRVGDELLLREARGWSAGSTATVSAPFGPAEEATLLGLFAAGRDGWEVPSAARAHLATLGEPVYLAAPGARAPVVMRVDSGFAARLELAPEPRADAPDAGPYVRGGVGLGWASTGDWFLQNVDAGAPYTAATVNAVAPALSAGGGWRQGWLVAGAGLDLVLPTGDWHSLPSGEGTQSAWVHPYASVGVPWVQATLGFQSPWYVGVGGLAEVRVAGPLTLFGRATYGAPVARPRVEGPTFEPLPAFSAWAGLGVNLGG